MLAGALVLVIGGRIQYTDELGRPHTRYVCSTFRPYGDELFAIGEFCVTPKQN
jgi:hypothetical protein